MKHLYQMLVVVVVLVVVMAVVVIIDTRNHTQQIVQDQMKLVEQKLK
jgi:hypothetical protein